MGEQKKESKSSMSYSFMSDNAGKAENDRGIEKREKKYLSLPQLDFKGAWYQ